MLWYVYQAVSQARHISGVYVLTDSQEVLDAALSWGAVALMTSEDCPTGTDRIVSVIDAMKADIIVNVQGDEPLITGQVIDQLVTALENSTADVATPVYPISTLDELNDPNVVKVARALDGSALYFSRSPVPYVRDADPAEWLSHANFWGHAGVYAYRERVLREFSRLAEGHLERVEKLEQLRLLEAGKRFLAVEIDYRPQAVDVPADLEAVRRILERSSNGP
jgi:3-deoxy-manno-octulosonate cytidylyltransferase (CMP-KDO synthetase)